MNWLLRWQADPRARAAWTWIRKLLPLVGASILLGTAAQMSFRGTDPAGPDPRWVRGCDLVSFWAGGSILDDGDAATLYTRKKNRKYLKALYPPKPPRYAFAYPPPIYQLFALPQPRLDYLVSAKLLMFGIAVLHAIGAALVVATAAPLNRWRDIALGLAIALPAAESVITSGQLGGLWVFLLGSGLYLRARGHPLVSGAVLAGMWMKPSLGLPAAVAFLLFGEWRVVLGMIAGGLGILGASLLAGGGPAWLGYLGRLRDPVDYLEDFWIHRMRQVTLRAALATVSADEAISRALGWVGVTLGIALSAWTRWQGRGGGEDPARRALALGATMSALFLATPHLFEYDLGMHLPGLVAAAAWIVAGRARWPRRGAALWLLAYFAGAIAFLDEKIHFNLATLVVGAWVLWMGLELRRSGEPGAGQARASSAAQRA
jgi:hypothetical protein